MLSPEVEHYVAAGRGGGATGAPRVTLALFFRAKPA